MDIEQLKYPIGRFEVPKIISSDQLTEAIAYIGNYPSYLKKACRSLDEHDLNQNYRPGGWKIKQVIHHLADSHMNALIRFKLALTEENPTIKPYEENEWAKLSDNELPIEVSLKLLEGVHEKWSVLMQNMSESDFQRCYFHPESKSLVSLKAVTLMYEWHSKHHLAHVNLPSLLNP